MDITQTFYNNMAAQYDELFADWQSTTFEQAEMLNALFEKYGFDKRADILDCACGIGTQAIGLARLGYRVTASDISDEELYRAKECAEQNHLPISFAHADFRALSDVFSQPFDIIIAMDNALPHMLTSEDLATAVKSITRQMKDGGMFVASIRDYDALLKDKPPYSPPYIHKTANGQRVSFQTWTWDGDRYRLIQYILEDEDTLHASRFTCEYRATRRQEITDRLTENGCREVTWLFPEETGFYQPIVVARK